VAPSFGWTSPSVSLPQFPLWECGTEDRGGGRGRTRWRGGVGGCLPERCRAPQRGETPLHRAAEGGYPAAVEQLLAAGAAVDVKDEVRGKWGADRVGLGGRTRLCVSSWFSCFVLLKLWVPLPGLEGELVTLLRCKRCNVADSPANHLKEVLRSHL